MKRMIKGVEFISVILLIFLSSLIFIQVLLRNMAGWGFVWSEEMARLLLLTIVLIMSPVVLYRDEHVGLDFFSNRIPLRYQKFHKALMYLLAFSFYLFYIFSHFNFIGQMGDVRTPSLNLPNSLFFIAGIIGAIMGVVVGVVKITGLFLKGNKS